MERGLLLLLAGSSGSGKNTIINYLTKDRSDVKFLVSQTTREIRPGEAEGVTYHYVTVPEFERAIADGEMLEYDITHKGYYGISKKTIDETLSQNKVVVKDLSVLGVVNCKKQLSHRVLINSVFLTESKHVLKKRLLSRGEKNWRLRLKIYGKEQSQMGVCDYIIRNSQLNNSIAMVEAIIYHGTNDYPLLPYRNLRGINDCLVQRYAKKIEKGHRMKPLKVALIGGKIYLLDRPEKYLASLQANKSWPKFFENKIYPHKHFLPGELNIWLKAIGQYDKH